MCSWVDIVNGVVKGRLVENESKGEKSRVVVGCRVVTKEPVGAKWCRVSLEE